jgi:hypothetical protein
MNPEDVFHDVRRATIERKRIFVSRSEVNGKIRWVIEIENEPFGSQVHSRLRDIFDHHENIRRDMEDRSQNRQDDERSNGWP